MKRLMAVLAVVLLGFGICDAQQRFAGPDETIDARKQLLIIDSVTTALDSIYVFPEKAKAMSKLAHSNYKKGVYKNISSAQEFVQRLTSDLMEICHDGHFGIAYAGEGTPQSQSMDTSRQAITDAQREQDRLNNFGFHKLEQLDGNIGYLDLRQFCEANWSGPTAAGAMAFLGNCDAIIIDLRQNGGGEPSMIQFLTSYFFEEPRHINSFYIRYRDTIDQFWTQSYVPGKKITDVPLYVLTSNFTYSAAEEFTYNLKNMKRATIVGETTGGGAHPVTTVAFPSLSVLARVPYGRAINPITGTNWEGTGVSPDIAVPQAKALATAHLEALKRLRENSTEPQNLANLDWAILGLKAELEPVTLDPAALPKFAGKYGPRIILLESGSLYYQREGRPKFRMIPLSQDTFCLDGLSTFRLRFVFDNNGVAKELIGMYDDGRSDLSPRTSD